MFTKSTFDELWTVVTDNIKNTESNNHLHQQKYVSNRFLRFVLYDVMFGSRCSQPTPTGTQRKKIDKIIDISITVMYNNISYYFMVTMIHPYLKKYFEQE